MGVTHILMTSSSTSQHGNNTLKLYGYCSNVFTAQNRQSSEFGHEKVTFLGHAVGQGQVKPVTAKICEISEFPWPESENQFMRFFAWLGFQKIPS